MVGEDFYWWMLEYPKPCHRFLETIMLGDGANVCPGTPLASFQSMMDAAEEFGLGEGKLPRWKA